MGQPSENLVQAWGDFLTGVGDTVGGWQWFATLTFRDPPQNQNSQNWTKPGWGYTGRAWTRFCNELGFQKGLHSLFWVRAREYQKWRGVPHYHALIAGVGDLRRDQAWSWWFQRYGFARILPYDPRRGAGFYLCKYITKDLGDVDFSDNLLTW